MDFETFILILGICSTVTGLITEAIKEKGAFTKVAPNVTALIVSLVVALLASVLYCVFFTPIINAKFIATCFCLFLCVWGVAMFGYDKIKQLIEQAILIKK